MVDHIIPHKGDMTLFWDPDNWQSLCFWCHDNTKRQIERYGYHKLTDFRGWPLDPNHPFNREKR